MPDSGLVLIKIIVAYHIQQFSFLAATSNIGFFLPYHSVMMAFGSAGEMVEKRVISLERADTEIYSYSHSEAEYCQIPYFKRAYFLCGKVHT